MRDFIREVRFEKLGVFTYSKEKGTKAAKMRGQVPGIKQSRYHQVMRWQNHISAKINQERRGKMLEVLIEKNKGGVAQGRSYREAPEIDGSVFVKANNLKLGDIVRVRVTKALPYDLQGVLST